MQYYDQVIIDEFLPCKTPQAWIDKALNNIDVLLLDHAHCEKKAASAAMSFMYNSSSWTSEFLSRMSKIAREELVHFEQVLTLMKKRNIKYRLMSESRYAKHLRAHARTCHKGRVVDVLIIGAFIEARSCERFGAVAPFLDEELQKFYLGLLASEKRHFTIYLNYANQYSDEDIAPYVQKFAQVEQELILSHDPQFRFHSGG